jgi:hypothetical protein
MRGHHTRAACGFEGTHTIGVIERPPQGYQRHPTGAHILMRTGTPQGRTAPLPSHLFTRVRRPVTISRMATRKAGAPSVWPEARASASSSMAVACAAAGPPALPPFRLGFVPPAGSSLGAAEPAEAASLGPTWGPALVPVWYLRISWACGGGRG